MAADFHNPISRANLPEDTLKTMEPVAGDSGWQEDRELGPDPRIHSCLDIPRKMFLQYLLCHGPAPFKQVR